MNYKNRPIKILLLRWLEEKFFDEFSFEFSVCGISHDMDMKPREMLMNFQQEN